MIIYYSLEYQDIVKIITQSAQIEQTNPIIREYQDLIKPVLFTAKPMKVVMGLRRSGKSFLLKQLYQVLLKRDIPPDNILFLNFESDYLLNFLSVENLREIFETFYRYAKTDKPFYVLLDEIQNIKHWEQFIRTIYDSTNHNIFITGSNSNLLSQEFASVLGGRLLQFEIYPFSFKEMLDYYHLKHDTSFERVKSEKEIKRSFDMFLSYGGLPETFAIPDQLKLNYRRNLIEKIIINDILKRFEIQSTELLSKIMLFLEKNIGTVISFNNIAMAANADEKTVAGYINYLSQTYLINPVNKFSLKTKQIFNTQKKYYFIDNLFVYLSDIEDRLENTVYIYLARKYGVKQVLFGKDEHGHEIDFIINNENGNIFAIQACYRLTDGNLKRETRSLIQFKEKNRDENISLYLIYMYDERKNRNQTPAIEFKNIVDFMLA